MLDDRGLELVLIDLTAGLLTHSDVRDILGLAKQDAALPVLALLAEQDLTSDDATVGFDDFLVQPYRPLELAARVRQCLWRFGKQTAESPDVITYGDLIIDLAKYEVYVAGRPVELTFKEYELLKFLATNPERVFTRETLLNRVWGYDYYGGARTVDVHIRRLRSKIEDKDHVYIETVRNVGYRFREAR
ncbi:MAG: response regulator transcription factor [Chloroflexi bacterium]|nr:response regulator transcription factor [Chloroflexota bacterium]